VKWWAFCYRRFGFSIDMLHMLDGSTLAHNALAWLQHVLVLRLVFHRRRASLARGGSQFGSGIAKVQA